MVGISASAQRRSKVRNMAKGREREREIESSKLLTKAMRYDEQEFNDWNLILSRGEQMINWRRFTYSLKLWRRNSRNSLKNAPRHCEKWGGGIVKTETNGFRRTREIFQHIFRSFSQVMKLVRRWAMSGGKLRKFSNFNTRMRND